MQRIAVYVAAFTVVAVILIAGAIANNARHRYENYLAGMWIGDPTFLKKAQLGDLQMFIAPAEDGSRQGYLIITDQNGEFISNQAIEMTEGSGGGRLGSAFGATFASEKDTYKDGSVRIKYDDGGEPPMPSTLKLSLSILDGSLTLYDDEKVYAFMEKDLASSAAALEAYGK